MTDRTQVLSRAEELQAALFVAKSNTEEGRRILDEAPPAAPGFGQFMGFLQALAMRKIGPVQLNPPVPDGVSAHRGLVFRTVGDKQLELDLLVPDASAKRVPVVVLVHGGCWMAGVRQEMNFYGAKLTELGYATATIDYRLSEDAEYPAAVDDCRAAIQWLKDHCDDYNLDPDRIALLGASAGGHLVQYLAYTASTQTDRPADGQGPRVKAIVSLYGWSDLADPSVNYQYYMELFLGKGYADAPELYEQASPINHVGEGDPATLILGGTIDTIVPITQAEKLAQQLDAHNVPYVYAPFRGSYHGFDMFTDANPGAVYFIERFLREYL